MILQLTEKYRGELINRTSWHVTVTDHVNQIIPCHCRLLLHLTQISLMTQGSHEQETKRCWHLLMEAGPVAASCAMFSRRLLGLLAGLQASGDRLQKGREQEMYM